MKVLRRGGYTILELLVTITIVCVLMALLMPPGHNSRGNARRSSCQSNLKQIGLAFLQYRQDHDERLPPAEPLTTSGAISSTRRAYGWVDAIFPYIPSMQQFQCPSQERKSLYGESPVGFTDYYMNGNAASQLLRDIQHPSKTLLCGDGNDGIAATHSGYNRRSLPASWLEDETSPAQRHLGGANYLWVDGHVKWLKPARVSSATATPFTIATFAIR